MEGNGQVLMPPVGQEGEKTRVLYRVGLETMFRLQVVEALIFSPLWLCFFPRYMFFSEMSETSRSSAAPRGARRPRPVAPARCRWGLFGGTVLAYSSCPPLAWDARWPHGVECPWDIPPSPSPTAPEPLSGFARQPAATQRAGRSGDLGPGSAGNRQTEGYNWGRKRICECDKSLQ